MPVLLLIAACAGCASQAPTHNVDYASLSSELYVQGADGRIVAPLGGAVVGVADMDFVLGDQAIGIPPGRHWIRTTCPPPADVTTAENGELSYIESSHGYSVEHDFEVGKAYLLRCVDGYPEIIPYESAQ